MHTLLLSTYLELDLTCELYVQENLSKQVMLGPEEVGQIREVVGIGRSIPCG
jgi:hypothetical protein